MNSLVKTFFSSLFALTLSVLHAEVNSWTGKSSGYWDDGANWSLSRAPMAGDDVKINKKINNSFTVYITNSTPRLKSLSLSEEHICTLVVSNWTTCISADTVTIGETGILTCANGADTLERMSRVHIQCGDLTIAAGGKIDVSKKGFWRPYEKRTGNGVGPGAGLGSTGSESGAGTGAAGASHGGYGGSWNNASRPLPYDNPSSPELPGSSGCSTRWCGTVVAGGGVVRIEATGTVTVNGEILASSAKTAKFGDTGVGTTESTAGSGGTIYISASVFKGQNGVLRADGGNSSCPTNILAGRVGGGGCIAVKYDCALQQREFVSGMTISAAPGIYKWKTGDTINQLGVNNLDKYRSEADLGTLWFSDDKMLESLGVGISGQILNVYDYTVDSLTITNGHVRFAEDGVKLTVVGDLVVTGATARLEIGGAIATNRQMFADLYSKIPSQLSVGGNLIVTGGGRLDIRAAETNGIDFVGATVDVAGTVSVTSNSSIYCWSDVETGGSPRFYVGSMFVASGAVVCADERGFRGGYVSIYPNESLGLKGTSLSQGAGPGGARNYASSATSGKTVSLVGGGGHGGHGGGYLSAGHPSFPKSYDDQFFPCMPGSGGAIGSLWSYYGGSGGGVVDIRARDKITIDGTVSADGGAGFCDSAGTGAGGTVFLSCKSFSGGANGRLSACGVDAGKFKNAQAEGASGGGRISVWSGAKYDDSVKPARIHRSVEPVPGTFAGIVSAKAGVTIVGEDWPDYCFTAEDGTVWFTHIADPSGLSIVVR